MTAKSIVACLLEDGEFSARDYLVSDSIDNICQRLGMRRDPRGWGWVCEWGSWRLTVASYPSGATIICIDQIGVQSLLYASYFTWFVRDRIESLVEFLKAHPEGSDARYVHDGALEILAED